MHGELSKRLIESFRWIGLGPQSSHLVSDTSAWWRDPQVLSGVGPALADLFRAEHPTVVVSPEVTGFLLGPLVAVALGAGFLPAHKAGADRMIAEPVTWTHTGRDYRHRRVGLGVRTRHLGPADRVLVVDDWVATGAQVRAVYELAGMLGATCVGTAALVADCPERVIEELGVRALLSGTDLARSRPNEWSG